MHACSQVESNSMVLPFFSVTALGKAHAKTRPRDPVTQHRRVLPAKVPGRRGHGPSLRGEKYTVENATIELLPTGHILGSA